MTVLISKRLQRIAAQIPYECSVADIGSDHALLPTYLIQKGIASNAVAGEVNKGPFEAAARQVKQSKLETRIDVRHGDGLDVIQKDEVDVICIAGMGGSLIVSILSAGMDKLHGVKKLVLQPNVAEERVREWLDDHGWFLSGEEVIEEDGKFYVILVAIPNPLVEEHMQKELYPATLHLPCGVLVQRQYIMLMGPYCLQYPTSDFFRKWEWEMAKLHRVVSQLSQSEREDAGKKKESIVQKIKDLEEVCLCLQKAQP
ncbi:tRNA (adenine(22)-N(1))-methyltransferase [Longirhabdus pacifica]|uniref:tRNA (adenine(22)-N(1))-methyltransferase n=1 Tax=Longirhabdus pacifica TaxID=2305227 RepID=UPI00100880AA|nr:class I SAM-dependent methyltransferase [Longirhabdus pacifica]